MHDRLCFVLLLLRTLCWLWNTCATRLLQLAHSHKAKLLACQADSVRYGELAVSATFWIENWTGGIVVCLAI